MHRIIIALHHLLDHSANHIQQYQTPFIMSIIKTFKTLTTIFSLCVQSATSLSASCTFIGSTELSLSWVSISPDDVESGDLAACFDKFGRENIVELFMTSSGNYFTSLPEDLFQGMVNIERILLSSQVLNTLPSVLYEGLGTLKNIGMYGIYDSLPEGIFDGLDSLEYIEMIDCDLTALPENIFQGLTSLVSLELRENSFRTLPDTIFDGLKSLEILDLSGNELIELSSGIFGDLTSLLELDIHDNYLLCYPQSFARDVTADEGISECEGGFTSAAYIVGNDSFGVLVAITTMVSVVIMLLVDY